MKTKNNTLTNNSAIAGGFLAETRMSLTDSTSFLFCRRPRAASDWRSQQITRHRAARFPNFREGHLQSFKKTCRNKTALETVIVYWEPLLQETQKQSSNVMQ